MDSKHAFWQAFIVTVAIFLIGIAIGFVIEENRNSRVNELYVQSELTLMDIIALNSQIRAGNYICADAIESNLNFADKIYEEALLLERYETSSKITSDLELEHRKYDLLRTLLWINSNEIESRCGEQFSTVVYLYEFKTEDLAKKATQNVWSKLLLDLKSKEGGKIILIPIAVDSDLVSLESMLGKYPINDYPAVIVNNQVITELESVDELEQYLK